MKPIVLIAYKSDGCTTSMCCVMDRWSSAFTCDWYPDFHDSRFLKDLADLHAHNLKAKMGWEEREIWGKRDPDGRYEIKLAFGDSLVGIEDRSVSCEATPDTVDYYSDPEWLPDLQRVNTAAYDAAVAQIEQDKAAHRESKKREAAKKTKSKEEAERQHYEALREKYEKGS